MHTTRFNGTVHHQTNHLVALKREHRRKFWNLSIHSHKSWMESMIFVNLQYFKLQQSSKFYCAHVHIKMMKHLRVIVQQAKLSDQAVNVSMAANGLVVVFIIRHFLFSMKYQYIFLMLQTKQYWDSEIIFWMFLFI